MTKKLKTGVIGLGRVGQIHLSNLLHHMPDAEVIIASDLSPASHAFAHNLGVTQVTTDAYDVINHPDVEAVIICSPTPFHVPYTVAAAKQKNISFVKSLWM